MQVNKAETISAFNQYIDKTKEQFKGVFTLTQFDTQGIDRPQDGVKIKEAVHLNDETYQPRGGTPLLDAIGKTVHRMDTEGFDNVIFVIITVVVAASAALVTAIRTRQLENNTLELSEVVQDLHRYIKVVVRKRRYRE